MLAAPADAGTVAITFDDLPIFPEFPRLAQARSTTQRLLDGFHRQGWPVTGFVNESQLDEGSNRAARIAVLKRWTDAGEILGNHTYSHASLTTTPADRYIADIARGDAVTRKLQHLAPNADLWFRYPYLESGATEETRHTVEAWLSSHHYHIAPVSLQNLDWVFAEPYDYALKHNDRREAAYIHEAYIIYTAEMVYWYKAAAVKVIGRQPSFVMLLHASALNAGSIDEIAAILNKADLHPVTLAQAMTDPAYAQHEDYIGKTGIGWVQRWAAALGKRLPFETLPNIPPDIQKLYDKIEAEDPDSRAAIPLPTSKAH